MTKRELIAALAGFDDDQPVIVLSRRRDWDGVFGTARSWDQLRVQGVRPFAPWKGGVPGLVGLCVEPDNRELPRAETDADAANHDAWRGPDDPLGTRVV